MDRTIIVTGGAGFIGSNFILQWLADQKTSVINLDKLTYSGNLRNLESVAADARYHFERGDINDRDLVRRILQEKRPRAILHFAAESHVDRSILGPDDFVHTNVNGTFSILEEARSYWERLPPSDRAEFRFLHVSTDEVYGSLEPADAPFHEQSPYRPNSPYSASKAAADHMVRAYHSTYSMPVLTSNCSNNYGPFQFPEKLIPLMILNAHAGKELPVYGDGLQVRDWLHVWDHCRALRAILERGTPGETYNVGGASEKRNLEVVETICEILDEMRPDDPVIPHRKLISFVRDRLGHDRRYAIDCKKLQRELGWMPTETFGSGLRKTVAWYLENGQWVKEVTSGEYREWIATQYSG
jgi:dTDP-glucose 4,6-dehydratase